MPEVEKTRLLNNIPVAYAVSYLVGTGFVVWFLSVLAPRLLKVNLKEESRKLEAVSRGELRADPNHCSGYRAWDIRAFRIEATWSNPEGRATDMEELFSSRPGGCT